jgi:hypothetical protein
LTSVGVVMQNATTLQLSGQGVFNWAGTGYSPTPGTFGFKGTGSGDTFSFSATQVPEPATLALLGAGLLAFAGTLSRRRRRNSQ